MVAPDPLTEDERQELADLRAKRDQPIPESLTDDERKELADFKAQRDNKDAADNAPLPDSHWLNLADGTTIKSKGVMSHVDGIPVVRATEIPDELRDGAKENAEPAHRF